MDKNLGKFLIQAFCAQVEIICDGSGHFGDNSPQFLSPLQHGLLVFYTTFIWFVPPSSFVVILRFTTTFFVCFRLLDSYFQFILVLFCFVFFSLWGKKTLGPPCVIISKELNLCLAQFPDSSERSVKSSIVLQYYLVRTNECEQLINIIKLIE